VQLEAQIVDMCDQSSTLFDVEWSVEDPALAEIDGATGILTGVAAGMTKVFAATGDIVAQIEVTVVMDGALCDSQTCNGNGECEDRGGVAHCVCNAGYTGASCDGCDGSQGFFPSGPAECVNPMRLGSNGGGPGLWLDVSIPGAFTTIPNTDTLVEWMGRSLLTQVAVGRPSMWPKVGTDAAGKPVVVFDDSSLLEVVSAPFSVGTIFVVARYTAGDTAFVTDAGLFSAAGMGTKDIYFTGESGQKRWLHEAGTPETRSRLVSKFVNGQTPMNPHDIPVPLGDWVIYSGIDPQPISSIHFLIGVDRTESGGHWVGGIREILVYDHALGDDERTSIEGYLNQKWSVY
jgi:hypothetical protein